MLWNMSHGLRFLGNEWSFLKVHSLGVISTCLLLFLMYINSMFDLMATSRRMRVIFF